MTVSRPSRSPLKVGVDTESRVWLRRLRATGPERDQALGELRELLLGAARFEVERRRAALLHPRPDELEDLVEQSADDALMAIISKLDSFRGESRFTTWAYKFALLEAAVKLRRRAWHGREVRLDVEDWTVIVDQRLAPDQTLESVELMRAIRTAIKDNLTPHQREILVAITLNDVPIDVLAERLNTTRGALYKTLHDARHNLRVHLSEKGFDIGSNPESQTQ